MERAINAFTEKHQLLKKNTTVLIGVSGGPDSMALLHYYYSIKEEWNLRLVALTVDHQLRGEESKGDLRYVQQVCQEWGIEFISAACDVTGYMKEHQVSTMVAARDVRYQFFKEQMKVYQAAYLALGHHGDDQVETMLMGFVRTASTKALSGIPIKREFVTGLIVRPLLCVTKADIVAYCEMNDITPRMDPSNQDDRYTRNYFRNHIIPLIKGENDNIHATVQSLSESLQEDEYFLQIEAEKLVMETVHFTKESRQATFKINAFKSYSLSLQRRGFHLVLNYLYNKLPRHLTYVHEELFFKLLHDDQGNAQLDFPGHLKVEKSYGELIFSFTDSDIQETGFNKEVSIPGKTILPDGSFMIANLTEDPFEADETVLVSRVKDLVLPLHIRTRQPGDRLSWKGLAGSKKIKDVFIDAKVPRRERDTWPIVTDDHGKILWLIGLRKGMRSEYDSHAQYVKLEYQKDYTQGDNHA
ncbi:MAG TPA: tRNA lysidine(34) synthetase TilS [Virgibacillus sp.]|nr:tRNA lysidine(34) synthetase TilS [Virgibacillus sp.]